MARLLLARGIANCPQISGFVSLLIFFAMSAMVQYQLLCVGPSTQLRVNIVPYMSPSSRYATMLCSMTRIFLEWNGISRPLPTLAADMRAGWRRGAGKYVRTPPYVKSGVKLDVRQIRKMKAKDRRTRLYSRRRVLLNDRMQIHTKIQVQMQSIRGIGCSESNRPGLGLPFVHPEYYLTSNRVREQKLVLVQEGRGVMNNQDAYVAPDPERRGCKNERKKEIYNVRNRMAAWRCASWRGICERSRKGRMLRNALKQRSEDDGTSLD
ncbi:hypothetical protein An07g02660 [Aspergillus niger]|uniref:Uncharacterized protein n=2 Tax=Aspergillus niger TaxID=5061 RepID=A2QMM6_ASPNC|nr:hypothetical protein An07g02660 [Aspergillus niger]CAK39354.1 hypothetical protein An07g02660 [Aspergillus niger]